MNNVNTKPDLDLHLSARTREQLKLALFAATSALLPYVAATLLLLIGQSL